MNPEQKKKPYRVLCVDGGAMRGLYTAAVLETLAQRFSSNGPLDVGCGFDLIAGTSTGGILACGLASGVPISRIIDIYRKNGPEIFSCPIPRNRILRFFWALWNMLKPANPNQRLKAALEDVFAQETIGQLFARRKIGLCIPAVNLSTHESRVFKTAHDPRRNADDGRTLVDVCLATSAAPIIFPIAAVNNPHLKDQISHFADGGLWANNPVLVGLVEALHMSEEDQPIEIISVGTCPPPGGGALLPKEAQRGLLGWNFGIKALELSMDAQASGSQFMAKFLVENLRRCGRAVTLLRLEQSAPSSEQATFLSLDNASPRATSTLVELGNSDALKIYGRAIDSSNDYTLLKSVFQTMPSLK